MLTKQELKDGINEIPKFVLRETAINNDLDVYVHSDRFKAVTEETGLKPLTFVTSRYNLLQFKDIFLPIVDNIPDLEGDLIYYDGMGLISLYPINENTGQDDKIGIIAYNSVNKQSSILIKYAIYRGGRKFVLPKDIAGFKTIHTANVQSVTRNFIDIMGRLRTMWNTIITTFTTQQLTEDNFKDITAKLEIDKQKRMMTKLIEERLRKPNMTLWDFFMSIIKIVEDRNYKTELHADKKMETITNLIFKYAITTKLIQA